MLKGWLGAGCVLVTGIGVLVDAGASRADIKYTQETRMATGDEQNGNAPMNKSTTYVKQDAERVETTTQYGTAQMMDVTLTLCEKRQRVRMNPKLKIYTVAPLDATGAATTGAAGAGTADKDTRGTGKFIMTYAVKDLGEETVAGFKTRHYMINMRMQSSGCAGNNDTSTKMEIWVADIKNAHACAPKAFDAKAMAGAYNPTCNITYEQKGDVAAITKAYSGLVMRMKMYNGDKVMMVQEITMLSQAKLEDAPFAIPADYKQVSEQEFQQMQTQAMMKAMTEKTDQDDAATGDDGNNAAGDEAKEDVAEEANDDAVDDDAEEKKDEDKKPEAPKGKSKPKVKVPKLKLPF